MGLVYRKGEEREPTSEEWDELLTNEYREHIDKQLHIAATPLPPTITPQLKYINREAAKRLGYIMSRGKIKFYTEILGFKEKMCVPEANLFIVASSVEFNGTMLLLEPRDNPIAKTYQEDVYKAGLPVIVFGVEDIQKEYERLKKLGVMLTKWKKKVI